MDLNLERILPILPIRLASLFVAYKTVSLVKTLPIVCIAPTDTYLPIQEAVF